MKRCLIALFVALALPLSSLPGFETREAHAASFENESEAFKFSREALVLAVQLAMDDPEKGLSGLVKALDNFKKFAPEIAADTEHQTLQRRGLLTLAQAQLYLKSHTAAAETLRALFLTDPPPKSELKAFGPSLRKLAKNQSKQIDKLSKTKIEVKCSRPCRIFVNERRISSSKKYPSGEYRIFVEDSDGKNKPMSKVIELRDGQDRWTDNYYNEFKEPKVEPKPLPAPLTPLNSPNPSNAPEFTPMDDEPAPRGEYRRILPLWLEVTGTIVGAGAAGGGGYLWYLHGRCGVHEYSTNSKGEKKGEEHCTKVYKSRPAGIALAVGGGVLFATSLTLWIVDASRKRKAESSGLAREFLRTGKIRF